MQNTGKRRPGMTKAPCVVDLNFKKPQSKELRRNFSLIV
jgi:hypothetical protein